MFEQSQLLLVVATFLFAGAVKGTIGVGLPAISIAVLAVFLPPAEAMAIVLVPALVSNAWQAAMGGHGKKLLRRLWPFLGVSACTVWVGTSILAGGDVSMIRVVLGSCLAAFALLNIFHISFSLNRTQERVIGPVLGVANGLLGGMTGVYAVPSVLFFQTIGLQRDALVQAMGIHFLISAIVLGAGMGKYGLLSSSLALQSIVGLVAVLVGMGLGQWLRKRLPETVFRRFFFIGLFLLGLFIVSRAIA